MKWLLYCAMFLVWSGPAFAIVYKWVDAQGKVQYGDRPPAGVHAEVVELLGTHVSHPASVQPSQVAAPASANPVSRDATAKNATAQQAVAADVVQSREKQCAEAQDGYKKLIEGRRLYKTGTTGERQYLTSEEIDSERLNAKQAIDTICNSPT